VAAAVAALGDDDDAARPPVALVRKRMRVFYCGQKTLAGAQTAVVAAVDFGGPSRD